jgi:hypothetical protein
LGGDPVDLNILWVDVFLDRPFDLAFWRGRCPGHLKIHKRREVLDTNVDVLKKQGSF